jgi:uncharacterized protein YceK
MRMIAVILVFLLSLTCTAGCFSVRTADTHNTTIAIQQYNTWVSGQNVFDRNVRSTVAQIGDHVTTYNTEIAKDQPDYSLLRANLVTDRQLLDQWGTGIDNLSAATDRFDKSTATLTYDNASKVRVKESLGMMTQYMKIYALDMGNARQHLIEYVDNAETYIRPDDPDYWNDNYRQHAMQAKDQALPALADGDSVLGNLTAQAQKLEQLQ